MFYEIPGFDPKTFTDEDLLKKTTELARKIAWASKYSTNMLGALQTMQFMIDNERLERIKMEQWKNIESYMTSTIESDPDLKPKEEDESKIKKTRKPLLKPTLIPIQPTLRPVIRKENREKSDDQ
jgi:hypothetical protein